MSRRTEFAKNPPPVVPTYFEPPRDYQPLEIVPRRRALLAEKKVEEQPEVLPVVEAAEEPKREVLTVKKPGRPPKVK